MAAVTLLPALAYAVTPAGPSLNIFPGSATPAVFPAGVPFWIGYGFVAEPEASGPRAELDPGARFELEVDGVPIAVTTDLRIEEGRAVGKVCAAMFPEGLAPGWHELVGHWHDAGRLVLSSRVVIEFVER